VLRSQTLGLSGGYVHYRRRARNAANATLVGAAVGLLWLSWSEAARAGGCTNFVAGTPINFNDYPDLDPVPPFSGWQVDTTHCFSMGTAGPDLVCKDGNTKPCNLTRHTIQCSALGPTQSYYMGMTAEAFCTDAGRHRLTAPEVVYKSTEECVPTTTPCSSRGCQGNLGCPDLNGTTFDQTICVPFADGCTADFEDSCNLKDVNFDNTPHGDEGRQASCDQCAVRGEPVNLHTRQAYVRPREAARIDLPLSDYHSLIFEVGWDSILSRADQLGSTQYIRTLGLGVRSNWDQRLILQAGNIDGAPELVTYLSGSEKITFDLSGACAQHSDCADGEVCEQTERSPTNSPVGQCSGPEPFPTYYAQPGKNAQLVRVNSNEWVMVNANGDRFLFETPPNFNGTHLHPRLYGDPQAQHLRLREIRPRSHSGYRFRLRYEGDTDIPLGVCEEFMPGATACAGTSRGLLVAVVAEMIEPTGTIRTMPSMEFKYKNGDATSIGEVVLDRILAGAYRAEGYTTSTLPVLARFNYHGSSGSTQRSRLASVSDVRIIPASTMAAKFAFSWFADSNRWQLQRVSEPVIDQDGVKEFATVEAFTWSSNAVATHVSDRTSLVAGASSGTSSTWTRNGASEVFTFHEEGDAVSCGDQLCGVGSRVINLSVRDPWRNAGPLKIVNEDGTTTFLFNDELDRPILECVVPSTTGTCSLSNGRTTLTTSVVPRRAIRTYYAGSSGVVRATAEWTNTSGTTVFFPAAPVNWLGTASTSLATCPLLTTALSEGGIVHNYKVTVFDHDSDGDGVLNELPDPATLSGGDYAVTRVTTVGVNNGLNRAGTCQVLGVDRYGRRDRSANERRFNLSSTSTWNLVEDVYRGYKNLTTNPRRTGLPSSFGVEKIPGTPAMATRVYSFRECTTGSVDDFYDEEGRLTCFEVPHGTSDFLRVRETTSLSPDETSTSPHLVGGLRRRTYTFTNQDGTIVWSFHRDETAGGRVHAERPRWGNHTVYRYDRTQPAAAADIAKVIEVLFNGSTRTTTSYAYDSFGRLTNETTSGAGLTTTQRNYEGYDKDSRPAAVKSGQPGGLQATTNLTYTSFDAPSIVTEPDGQGQRNWFGSSTTTAGLLQYIDRRPANVSGFTNDAQVRTYDRLGRLASVRSGWPTTTQITLTRDGLGRTLRTVAAGVGIQTDYAFDDLGRVSGVATKQTAAPVTPRVERRLYDGLGRRTEVCNQSILGFNATSACTGYNIVENTAVYDSHGPFTGQVCPSSVYSPSYAMTGRYLQGRLGYATDSDGATAYEYDALGRVTVVMRHEGSLTSFSSANLVCTRYEFTSDGSLWQMTLPSGRRVQYNYGGIDAARPVSVLADINPSTLLTTIASNITYDTDGSVKSYNWFGSSIAKRQVTRDVLMRITGIVDYNASGGKVLSVDYNYDLDGDLIFESDQIAPTMLSSNPSQSGVSRSYATNALRDYLGGQDTYTNTYDNEGRITSISGQSVTYDSQRGERALSDAAGLYTYAYNTLGQVTTITPYFGGARTLSYGLRGELKQHSDSTGTWTYHYDSQMRRVRKADPGNAMHWRFRYGLGRDPVADYTKYHSNGSWGSSEWITLNGVQIAAVYSSSTNSGTLHAVHTDRMGIPRKVSTVAGTVVATLPMQTTGQGNTVIIGAGRSLNHRYAGQMFDEETGLINNGYRSLWNGRYTSPDPLHLHSQMQFIGAQAYTYAAHRPQVNQDPDGRFIPLTNPYALGTAVGLAALGLAAASAIVGPPGTLPNTGTPQLPSLPDPRAVAAAAAAAAAAVGEMCRVSGSPMERCTPDQSASFYPNCVFQCSDSRYSCTMFADKTCLVYPRKSDLAQGGVGMSCIPTF